MKVPSIQEAEALLAEGSRRNPGAWVKHSVVAAETARAIAERHPLLDPDAAYVLVCCMTLDEATARHTYPTFDTSSTATD